MKKHSWSTRIIIKYTLLQVPGLAVLIMILIIIGRFVEIPVAASLGIVLLWVLKDVILFPFVWRAYDSGGHVSRDPVIGLKGTAVDRLAPLGYIKVRGELWKAELIDTETVVEKGENVKVREINGLILIVTPISQDSKV